MTEAEWLACEDLGKMLIYLRGEVLPQYRSSYFRWTDAGEVYDGPSPFVAPARFVRFVAACAVRVPASDEPTRQYLDAFERYSEGRATADEVRQFMSAMQAGQAKRSRPGLDFVLSWFRKRSGPREVKLGGIHYLMTWPCNTPFGAGTACYPIASDIAVATAFDSLAQTCAWATPEEQLAWDILLQDPLYQERLDVELREQAHLLRDVIGNPFSLLALDPSWVTPTVTSVAHTAYEKRLSPSGHLDPAGLAILSDALEEAGCDDHEILSHLRSPGPHVRGCWALDLVLGKS